MTILLTGATGFLGSHLLEALTRKGLNVVILKRTTSNTWRINPLLARVRSYNIDTQPVHLAFEQQSIDAIIHTACCYGRKNESLSQVIEGNLNFGLKVLEAGISFGTKTFINTDTFFNSEGVFQQYLGSYTLSKRQFLDWLRLYSEKIQVVNLKLQHIYGNRDEPTKFIPWLISQLKQKAPSVKMTKGEQLRDFIFVDDVISAYLTALYFSANLPNFSSLDVGSGVQTSIREMTELIRDVFIEKTGSNCTEFSFGALPYHPGEIMSACADISPLKRLNWNPKHSLRDGVNKIISLETKE